jgi:AcrR family transcriptional regulator
VPAPARTSREAIVAAGRNLLEQGGPGALTMQAVAEAVGVRAPSIYKRLRDRDELVRLVTEAVVRDLGAVLHAAAVTGEPRSDLRALVRAARGFAHRHPQGYALVYAPAPEPARPDGEVLAGATAPLLAVTATLVGEEQALPAARTVVAWLHGFLTMELAGAFRLGGDVGEAFEFGVERLVEVLAGR